MTAEEIQSLVTKWGPTIDQSRIIFTWTERETLAYLAEHASKCDYVVELGTYMGRSARVMLDAGCKNLWCVDSFQVAGTLETSKAFLREYLDVGKCDIIVGDSTKAAKQLACMTGKLQMVWVDDGHETEQVKADIAAFLPLLKSGGLLCGHDFDIEPFNDVAQGVIASLPSYDLPMPRLWSYIKP